MPRPTDIDDAIQTALTRLDVVRQFITTSEYARQRFVQLEREIRELRAQRAKFPPTYLRLDED